MNRSTGTEVNENIKFAQTSVGLETYTGPPDEYIGGMGVTSVRVIKKKAKEQLNLLADML